MNYPIPYAVKVASALLEENKQAKKSINKTFARIAAAAAALLRERCGEKPVLLATHDREAIRLLGWPVVELENA